MKKTIFAPFVFLLLILSGVYAAEIDKIPPQKTQMWDRVLRFSQGYFDFKNFVFPIHESEYVKLAKKGQCPKTLFIGCSDSRVIPELFTQSNPGELFVIRNAGNFVSIYDDRIGYDGVAATIQYAIEVLCITDIVVCGHSHCGAIQALFATNEKKSLNLVNKWIQFGNEAKEITIKLEGPDSPIQDLYTTAGKVSVIFQLKHLMTYPFIKKLVEEKQIYLHGWYYIIETGKIEYFDPETDRFHSLDEVK